MGCKFHIEHWQKTGKSPTSDELAEALNNTDAAIAWQSFNAEYWEMQALLHYYQALHNYHSDNQNGFASSTELAANGYREAIRMRPNWPYSWANLALMKASVNQFDTEYEQAINQAVMLGPWENAVNISVAEAGMLGWSTLTPDTQAAVMKNIERGIKRNNGVLKKRLSAINKLGLACLYLQGSKARKRLCGF